MSTISNDQPSWRNFSPVSGRCLSTDKAKPRDGRIIAVGGQVHAEAVGQQVGARGSRDEPAAVVALDQRRLLALFDIVGEGAGKRGKDAARGHDPVEMAIFVVDERKRHVGVREAPRAHPSRP